MVPLSGTTFFECPIRAKKPPGSSACGQRLEVLQRFSDAPLRECPQSGGALTKLISAPALQFKGSGFYVTDYGGKHDGSKGEKAAPKCDAPKTEACAGCSHAKDAA